MLLVLLIAALLEAPRETPAPRPAAETHRSVPLASAAARRGDHKPELQVTIWYPATAGTPETPYLIGPPDKPLFDVATLAVDARPEAGKHPVILLSHGFGGTADDMGWLAAPLARAGYVVISVDHPGNNALDKTLIGATAWWERPRDLIAALDAMTRDPEFAPLIDRDEVAAAGYSMGGATALALAGARIDAAHFDAYCRADPADGVCQPPPEMPGTPALDVTTGLAKLGLTEAAAHAGEGTTLPNLRAVLSIAPNAQTLTPASLRRIAAPVVVIGGERDATVPIAHQAGYAAGLIPHARLVRVPTAAHYSFIATCTDAGRAQIPVCRLALDQPTAHRVAIAEALALFGRTMPTRR